MNGNTLKNIFAGIIATLMFVLLGMTILVCFGKMNIEIYKDVLTTLGIPTIIGFIIQAFLRSDSDNNGVPDIQEETKKLTETIKKTEEEPKP